MLQFFRVAAADRSASRAAHGCTRALLPLTAIFIFIYIHNVEYSVLFTDEFESWWNSLSIEEQESV